MVHYRFGLVMLNLDRRLWSGLEARPFDVARYYVLRTLEPFETDHGSSGALRFAALDAAQSKLIHLFAGYSRLGQLNAAFHRDPNPRIGNVSVEFVRIQPTHNTPCFSSQHHYLFCRTESLTVCADHQHFVN